MKSKLDIIIGCMFSGKSTELINRIRAARVLFRDDEIMIVNHESDIRYTSKSYICSHDQESTKAISVNKLRPLLYTEEFVSTRVVFIDEAQFFDDLHDFVNIALYHEKWVVVCGLDGDFERKPFGQILNLIPLSDSLCKLSALCKKCNDGTSAIFSRRISNTSQLLLVGSEKDYEAVCRYHFYTPLPPPQKNDGKHSDNVKNVS